MMELTTVCNGIVSKNAINFSTDTWHKALLLAIEGPIANEDYHNRIILDGVELFNMEHFIKDVLNPLAATLDPESYARAKDAIKASILDRLFDCVARKAGFIPGPDGYIRLWEVA